MAPPTRKLVAFAMSAVRSGARSFQAANHAASAPTYAPKDGAEFALARRPMLGAIHLLAFKFLGDVLEVALQDAAALNDLALR